MSPKWHQDGFQIDMFELHGHVFMILINVEKTLRFPTNFALRRLWNYQFFSILGT